MIINHSSTDILDYHVTKFNKFLDGSGGHIKTLTQNLSLTINLTYTTSLLLIWLYTRYLHLTRCISRMHFEKRRRARAQNRALVRATRYPIVARRAWPSGCFRPSASREQRYLTYNLYGNVIKINMFLAAITRQEAL